MTEPDTYTPEELQTFAALGQVFRTDERALLRFLRASGVRGDDASFYCPLCRCRKSGTILEPNGRDESCDDRHCVCHAEITLPDDDHVPIWPLDRRGDPDPLPFEVGGDAMDWADGNEQFGGAE